jgi:hypothetical protein
MTSFLQTERSTIRAYELILPPGAPGGAGYGPGVSIITNTLYSCTNKLHRTYLPTGG